MFQFSQFSVGANSQPPAVAPGYFAESSAVPGERPTARRQSRRDEYDDDDDRGGRYGRGEKLKAGVPIPAFLPFFDLQQTADETHEMRMAYRRMLADPTVKANFLSKIMSVMALDVVVKPPKWLKDDAQSIEIAEFIDWNLKQGMHEGVPGLVWNILSGGLMDGYSVCERVWGDPELKGRWKGKRRLACLKAKDVNQDLVPELDEFKNIIGIRGLRYNSGEVFKTKDFVIYSHLGLFKNPTGMSDFRAVYGRYWLLDTVWKLRALACEKRALPVIVGSWKDPTHAPKLEAALSRIRYQNWISAPESAQVTALEIAGQSHQIFSETVRDLREEITIGLKGAMLQSMTGEGPRGNSTVHKDTSDLFSWHLSAVITHVLNDHDAGVVRDIADRNYSGVEDYPTAAMGGIDDAELGESLKIDQGLAQMVQPMGLMLKREELEDRYGRTFEDAPMPAAGVGPNGLPGGGAGDADAGAPTEDDFASIMSDLGGSSDGDTESQAAA